MKRFIGLFGVTIATMALFSCYVMSTQSTGTISFKMPTVGSRASVSTSGQVGATVRVYLYTFASGSKYSLYQFPGGQSYKDFTNDGSGASVVSLDNVPSGLWKVLVATGSVSSDGFMSVKYYGSSDVFNLVPNAENEISLTINPSPFSASADLLDKDIVGVRVLGSTVYAATSDTLYSGDSTGDSALAAAGNLGIDLESATITAGGNAIEFLNRGFTFDGSVATQVLFVNTSLQGIVPVTNSSADMLYSDGLVSKLGTPITSLRSGAFSVTTGTAGVGVFYQRDGGLGGAFLSTADDPAADSWVDFDTAGIVSGQPVYDFVTHGDFAYVATKLGAFRLDQASFNAGGDPNDILNVGKTFTVPSGATIQALDISNDATLYIGTSNGLYSAALQEGDADNPIATAALVTGTAGDSFTKIAANTSGDIAFRSLYNLYIIDSTGTTTTYPFYSGLPGELQAMAWGGTSGKTLYVAGDKGLVAITVAD